LTPRPAGADRPGNLRYPVTDKRPRIDIGEPNMGDDSDYKHGEMDISAQEKTFAGFMRFSTNVVIICLLIVIGLAIFAT
jgi:hypothetical protein